MSEFIVIKDHGMGFFEVSNCAGSTYGMFNLEVTAQRLRDQLNAGLAAQAEIERLRAELAAKDEAIACFKAGLIRAGAKVPIDAMTMNAHEQGLTAALVYLDSELDRAAKRKYDLASIVSRGEQDDEN